MEREDDFLCEFCGLRHHPEWDGAPREPEDQNRYQAPLFGDDWPEQKVYLKVKPEREIPQRMTGGHGGFVTITVDEYKSLKEKKDEEFRPAWGASFNVYPKDGSKAFQVTVESKDAEADIFKEYADYLERVSDGWQPPLSFRIENGPGAKSQSFAAMKKEIHSAVASLKDDKEGQEYDLIDLNKEAAAGNIRGASLRNSSLEDHLSMRIETFVGTDVDSSLRAAQAGALKPRLRINFDGAIFAPKGAGLDFCSTLLQGNEIGELIRQWSIDVVQIIPAPELAPTTESLSHTPITIYLDSEVHEGDAKNVVIDSVTNAGSYFSWVIPCRLEDGEEIEVSLRGATLIEFEFDALMADIKNFIQVD